MADDDTQTQPTTGPRARRAARDTARQADASKQGPRTPEERDAERRAERARKAKVRRAYRAKAKAKAKAQPAPAAEAAGPVAPLHAERPPARPKVRRGVVTSDKADKSITVRIDEARRHRRYQKVIRSTSTLHAHDERNEAHEGDTVQVVETRPMSRTKRWRLLEVLERAR